MEILRYPVKLEKDTDGITVTFPDMPYGVTFGHDTEDALDNAVDCLEEIIASLMQAKQDIPQPSCSRKNPAVTLSPEFSAKVLLYSALRAEHISKAELARRLHWKYPQVDRLFDTHHHSRWSQLMAAAQVLGKTFVVGMENNHKHI